MDYYRVLGVNSAASFDTIKQSYRKLAAIHHPDKGGETAAFQSIAEAYATLSNPVLRMQYDLRINRETEYTSPVFDWEDLDEDLYDLEKQYTPPPEHNKNIHVTASISLAQSYTGVELETSYALYNGKIQTVRLTIPEGVVHGQLVKFKQLGDDLYPTVPRGDLIVSIAVEPEENYARRGYDLLTRVQVSAIEAMIGCSKIVSTIDGVHFEIPIRPGTLSGSEIIVSNLGFKNGKRRGNFCAVVDVHVPAVTSAALKKKLREISDQIHS